MNIYTALKQVGDWRKAEYFKWKYDIRYDQRLPQKTEEEFLKFVGRRSFNPYLEWEKSQEYKDLVSLLLESRTANDLVEIYESVSKLAREGDPRAVDTFLKLSKEIKAHTKKAKKSMTKEENEDLGLDLG